MQYLIYAPEQVICASSRVALSSIYFIGHAVIANFANFPCAARAGRIFYVLDFLRITLVIHI